MRRNPRRAEVDPQHPAGWATSDRNGHVGNLKNMRWQHEWRGSSVVNTRVLVHEDELDEPQRQLGTLVIPADPPPLMNARPENYSIDEEPVSTRYTIGPDGRASLIRIIINNEPWYSNRIVSGPGGVAHSGVNSSSGGTVAGTPAGSGTTFDASTVSGVTLTNGNLTATNNGSGSITGAKSPTASSKSSGKYYIEMTFVTNTLFSGMGWGIDAFATSYDDFSFNEAPFGVVIFTGGEICVNNSIIAHLGVNLTSGDVIALAADFDNHKIWFRVVAGPDIELNWNGSGAANPATNAGGISISSGPKVVFATFDDTDATEKLTANFGATAFSGTVPTGFTSGWPA